MVSPQAAHELSATLSLVLVPQPLVRDFQLPPVASVLHAAVVECSDDCSLSEDIKYNIKLFIGEGGVGRGKKGRSGNVCEFNT